MNESKTFRASSDKRLAQLSKQLGDSLLLFTIPKPVSHTRDYKLCFFNPFTRRWVVRMSLGGRVRVIGHIRNDKRDAPEIAVRFTDMAILYFWKYRWTRAPMDLDFNISLESATEDLKDCPFLPGGPRPHTGCAEAYPRGYGFELLKCIERHLLESGALAHPNVASATRTFKGVSATRSEWRRGVRAANSLLALVLETNPRAKVSAEMVVEAIATAEKYFEHVVNEFAKPENEGPAPTQPLGVM